MNVEVKHIFTLQESSTTVRWGRKLSKVRGGVGRRVVKGARRGKGLSKV